MFLKPQLWCQKVSGSYQASCQNPIGLLYHNEHGVPLDKVDCGTMELLQWTLVNNDEVRQEDKDELEARGAGTVDQAQ
jgi:hypothetical protein